MIAGIVVVLLVTAAATAWVAAPLCRADALEPDRRARGAGEAGELQSRHDMLVASLRDLEDDRATNKLDERDYRELQERLSAEAIVVMRRLDELAREHERAEAAAVVPYPRGRRADPPR